MGHPTPYRTVSVDGISMARYFSIDSGEPEPHRQEVPSAQIHFVDGGHFALDTAAYETAALIRRVRI